MLGAFAENFFGTTAGSESGTLLEAMIDAPFNIKRASICNVTVTCHNIQVTVYNYCTVLTTDVIVGEISQPFWTEKPLHTVTNCEQDDQRK